MGTDVGHEQHVDQINVPARGQHPRPAPGKPVGGRPHTARHLRQFDRLEQAAERRVDGIRVSTSMASRRVSGDHHARVSQRTSSGTASWPTAS